MLRNLDKDLKIIYGAFILLIIIIFLISSISASLIDGITSYYKLDEVSGAVIDSHNDNDGTNYGATTQQTGIINYGYSFDGSNDYVSIPDGTTGLSTFSVSLWFYVNAFDGNDVIIGQWDDVSGNYRSWMISMDNSGNLVYHESSDGAGSGYKSLTISGAVSTGEWYHLVLAKDGANVIIYKNNSVVGSSSSMNSNLYNYSGDIKIATSDGVFGAAARYMNALFDEIGIWSRDLSDVEVEELWNDGNGLAYPFVVDTCTCAGAGNNWEIEMSDYCNITEDCDLTTGTLSFTGAGWINCSAAINTTNLGDPGATGILWIYPECKITIN